MEDILLIWGMTDSFSSHLKLESNWQKCIKEKYLVFTFITDDDMTHFFMFLNTGWHNISWSTK